MNVFAQYGTVTGIVTDESGESLPGVNVIVKDSRIGTITDGDGKYIITAPNADATLVFSYIGMITREIVVGDRTNINVIMQGDIQKMDEVVVVAYGSARKKDLTGAVSTIDSKIISQQQLSSVSRAFEGAVAGVRTASITGQPGTDAKIIVRGLGSVEGSVGTEALIVVDGIPMYNTSTWSMASANTSFSSINPNDIESITVSKDAASNALYGSRGANGVVFVTTKKGAGGKARVTLESRFGINQQGVPDMDMVKDPQTYYEYAWQMIYNRYRYIGFEQPNTVRPNINNPAMSHEEAALLASRNLFLSDGPTENTVSNGIGNYSPYRFPVGEYLINTDGKLNPNAQLLYYDNWNKFFIKDRFRQEYNLSIQGGSDKHTYYVSLGYLNDPAYIVRSKFERYSTHMAINSQIERWLTTNFQVNYSHRNTEFQNNSDNPGSVNANIFLFKNFFNPMWALYAHDLDGNIKRDPNTGEPLYDLGSGQTESQVGATRRANFSGYSPAIYVLKDRRFQGSDDLGIRGEATATFLRDFKATVNLSMNNQYTKLVNYGNNVSGSDARDDQGNIQYGHGVNMAITTQQLVTWNKSFDKNKVDVMVGHEYWWLQTESTTGSWRMMLIPYFQSADNATTYTDAGSIATRDATEGYFSRVNYSFDERYLLSASLRRDGTTKFDKNKWGTFWSVGGAWRISQESFIEAVPVINDLKLRASYGTMGNANINSVSPTMTTWSISNAGSVTAPIMGVSQGAPANQDLTWETNKQFDVGIDFRLWKRFYGTVDYFNRITDNMIWNRPLSPSTGVSSRWENIGSLRNYGIEIELGVAIINTENVRWNFEANIAFLRNKLLSMPPGVGMEAYGGGFVQGNFLRAVGKDWYNLYTYKYAGIDPDTGLGLLYKELTDADIESGRWSDHKVGDIVTTDNLDPGTWDDPSYFERGSANPKATGGFNTSLNYKNWDLSIICAYQIGGKYYSADYAALTGMSLSRGVHKDNLDAWSPENPNGRLPMRFNGGTTNATGVMSWFDASYFNLKSVTLGYNFSKALMNRWQMNGIRIYAAVDNAFLLSAKKGLDPRYTLSDGSDVNAFSYPQARYLSLGFNFSF
ncbi:MAG: SusC/RagA family TonB-linked outer membrane protein [Candidatus Azobacteroides sp.]|nr:SusC/RagA family TonB-linked outer membrane protein [Candidatus Azobacteroides sp.]